MSFNRRPAGHHIVGLAEGAVREAETELKAQYAVAGSIPNQPYHLKLSTQSHRKVGYRFDLPIAIAILAASNQIPAAALSDSEFIGELGLLVSCGSTMCYPAQLLVPTQDTGFFARG